MRATMAFVWLANGLFCKVFNWVPRHQQIIGEILGEEYSRLLAILIGLSEIVMALWVVTGFKRKFNAGIQIAIVGIMNILEFFLVPHLLLWGKLNAVFALAFIVMVYYNEFELRKLIAKD